MDKEPATSEELQKYVETLQSDVTKLQIKLFKSEEDVRKLQELNTKYCKVVHYLKYRIKTTLQVITVSHQNLNERGKKWSLITS